MPNCTQEFDSKPIDFGRLGRCVIEGRFDGGSMTCDGGVMLLGQVDRKLGLMDAAARCIADPRSPLLIKHGVRDMLRQRVYGLALGWEDLNDHGTLHQVLVDQFIASFKSTPEELVLDFDATDNPLHGQHASSLAILGRCGRGVKCPG